MPARRVLRKVRRVARWTLLIALALIVIGVGTALIVVHTDWGRNKIRGAIVSAMAESFPCGATVESLDGSVLGDVTLRGVRLQGCDGQPAVTADRVDLNLDLGALASKTLELEYVRATGVTVNVRKPVGGPVNLAAMYHPTPGKLGWNVVLDAVTVDGAVALDIDGRVAHLDAVDLAGGMSFRRDGTLSARLAKLASTWREQSTPVAVSTGEFTMAGGALSLEKLDARLDGIVAVTTKDLHYVSPHDAKGNITVDLDAKSLQRFYPEQPDNPAVHVSLDILPHGGDLALNLQGTIGDQTKAKATLAGELYLDPAGPPRIGGTVAITGANARWFSSTAVKTSLAGTAIVALTFDRRDILKELPLSGSIGLDATGTIGELTVDHAGAQVFIAGRDAYVTALASTPGEATATAIGVLEFAPSGAMTIADTHVIAHVADVNALAPSARLRGAISADVTINGVISDQPPQLTVAGTVTGRGLRRDRIRVARADLTLSGTHIDFAHPDRPGGRARLTVTGATVNGSAVPTTTVTADSRADGGFHVVARSSGDHLIAGGAKWSVDLDAVVHPRDRFHAVSVALGDYALTTDGVPWSGHGGTVDVAADKITFKSIAGAFDGGTFALDGTVRPRSARADGTIALTGVDLAHIDRALGLTARGIGPLRGTADVTADLHRRRGQLTGTIKGAARGFAFRAGADPIDVAIDATVEPTRIAGTLDLSGGSVGTAKLEVDLAPPRDPTDLAAWGRLDRSAIRTATAHAENVDLAEVAAVLGVPPPIDAKITADLQLTPDGSVGELHAHDLVVPGAPAMIDLDATFDLAKPGVVATHATAALREIGTATIDATVAIPTRPFDLAAWRKLDVRALSSATVTVDEIELDDKLATRLGLPAGIRGRFGGSIDIGAALSEIHARIAARGVTGGPLAQPIDVIADGTLDASGVTATVTGSINGVTALTATATAPLDPDDLARVGVRAALAGVPITGKATLAPTELRALLSTLGSDRKMRGTLKGDGTFAGTLDAPTAKATLEIDDLGGAKSKVKKLVLDAAYADGVVSGELRGDQEGGGRLHATGRYDLGHPEATTIALAAVRFQIAPVMRLIPDAVGFRGVVDANLNLTGLDPATAKLDGHLRVMHAQVPIADQVGAIMDGTADITIKDNHVHATAKGSVESGEIELAADTDLVGLYPTSGTVDLTIRDVTVITTLAPRFATQIHADISKTGERWKVAAKVSNTEVVIPDEGTTPLHQASPPNDMVFVEHGKIKEPARRVISALLGIAPSDPFLIVDLQIDPVRIESKQLHGVIEGHLSARVGVDGILIEGMVEARRGQVSVFDRQYVLAQAQVIFDGGIDPTLRIEMSHEFPEMTMTVLITGRLAEPKINFASSSAGYTEGQMFGFLVGGSPGTTGQDTKTAVTGAATTVASQTVGGFLTRKLPVKLDVLRFEPATTTSSAAFAFGKWITEKLMVLVRSRIAAREDENRGETEVQWWVGRRVLLDAVGGDRGVLGTDILWTKSW